MNSPRDDSYFDEDEPIHKETFKKISVPLAPDPDPGDNYPPPDKSADDPSVDVLGLGPLLNIPRSSSGSSGASGSETSGRAMTDLAVAAEADGGVRNETTKAREQNGTVSNALQKTAALAMEEGEMKELASRPVHRVDSAQESTESVPQLPSEQRTQRSGRASPLKLQTNHSTADLAEDSILRSPTLSKHIIQPEDKSASSLPPVQATSPTVETPATSGRKESLPSFRELAGLADIASQQAAQAAQADPRPPAQHSHQHSQSFSSATSQSPMLPYHPSYAGSAQTSPVSYGYARSPTGTIGEGMPYSPSQYPGSAYYADRRTSAVNDSGQTYPTPVPSLPSNPSSGESQIGTDGYSTSHTTPVDMPGPPLDGMQRPILPPPPGMIIPIGGFVCDYPGCNAASFQTQYLLSSHRNVHSQSRPHYCPVKECPRSEGGKGFKRKNEMIRHGLVHNSPGYICPFCPDREHRYPRPDNLQRHVRVHHVDKDRDDPALREVLAQRSEGAIQKQRRRRAQGSQGRNEPPDSAP